MTAPHWLPDRQDFAVQQERWRHDQALYAYGEYTMFALMWTIRDHDTGLVGRCPRCYLARGKVSEVYKQSDDSLCPECYGTTFEGGYKALIVRPALWDANEEDEREAVRGEVITATSSVQSTSDFRLRTGDHLLRADGTRWQMRTISTNHLRTGFAMPRASTDTVGWNFGTVSREDESSASFLIGPTPSEVVALLDVVNVRRPQSFQGLDVVRGLLL